MAGGLVGRLGSAVAAAWGRLWSCGAPPEEVMPDYEGLPRHFRPPKKPLSHISEGRESAFTRSTVRQSSPLDEASMAEHDELTGGQPRFYSTRSQSLPSGVELEQRGSGERTSQSPYYSSTPRLSESPSTSRRRSSSEEPEARRLSLEALRPSMESTRTGLSWGPESVQSGTSWVPELPSAEELAGRRRRRSTDMLGGLNAARQRIWEGRDILASVDEGYAPHAPGKPLGRLDAYLDEQRRRAPLDARRRRVTRDPDGLPPPPVGSRVD